MRFKDLWEVVPLPSTLNLFWTRVNLTRWTKVFFYLVLVHCIVQIGLQFGAYANNRSTESSFGTVIADMVLTPKPFAFMEKNGTLILCSGIPKQFGGDDPCVTLDDWEDNEKDEDDDDSDDDDDEDEDSGKFSIYKRFNARPILASVNVSTGAVLTGLDESLPNGGPVSVTSQCLQTFPWIFDIIHDSTREDLVFVLYQGWLFSISAVAIFKQSIPHIAAALASECLATAWSMYKVAKIKSFQNEFNRVTIDGVCAGVNVLPHYFEYRQAIEATILALNLLAFIAFAILTWKLYEEFAPRMLKRVGSREDMMKIYRVVLSLSTVLHLSAFFLIAVAGLFIDQLFIGRISALAKHLVAYEAIFLLVIALTVPWVLTGLISTRRESRIGMVVFFALSVVFLAIWGVMFRSDIYRFMFFTWPFFATTSITACLLLITVMGLSIYAFLNFGLGFPEYMKASTAEHPADKVAWTLAYKPDLEQKGYGDDQSDTFTQMQRGSLSRSQSARSNGSSGSKFSLETSPSRQGVTIRPLSKDNIQPSIAQPIVANISLPQILGNDPGKRKSQASSIKPTAPPGLDAPPPPRKPNGALLATPSLVIPASRWSATTIGSSLPSTPAPVSATGITMNGSRRSKAQQDVNQSRWSSSTTATTTTTTTSSSRADEALPPVPELPRVPPSAQGAETPSASRRNVI